jgi:outer membrane protein
MIQVRFLQILALTAVAAANPPELPKELSLSQALNIAFANSTEIRIEMARLEQAVGKTEQFRSALLPEINIGARQGYQTINLPGFGIEIPGVTQGLIGPFASMDARVFLNQQLFNLADRRAWQSSRVKEDSSRLLATNARELVALKVVATYLDALRAKSARDTLLQQTKLAQDLYGLARDRVNHKVAAELDANRAMQQVNSLEQARQEAEHNYVTAKLTLANIIQARITSDYAVYDEAAYGIQPRPDRDTAIKVALASRFDYRSAEEDVRAAELQVRSVKASRLPTLGLTFSDGQSGTTPEHNVNTYRVQGWLNIPVFTGGRTHGEIEEGEGSLREAQASLDENRSQIETDVLDAISGIEWALQEVDTSFGNLKLARQEVELTQSRFAQGIADNSEVVNAQDRLARAENASIQARFNLGLARANLARATGVAEKTYRR